MLFMSPVFKRIPCLMNFDLSHSIEVLTVTPPTLRALLGNVSEHWTHSNSDLGFRISDFQRTGFAESDKSSEVRNPKSEIPNRQWSPFDVLGHLIHGEKTDWIPRAKIILEQGDDLTFVPSTVSPSSRIRKGSRYRRCSMTLRSCGLKTSRHFASGSSQTYSSI